MTELQIFISSKMVELKDERDALFAYIPTLNTGLFTLKPWVFEEDAPASEKPIREIYLKALRESELYIGLFWNQYGEYTIDEFDRAGEWSIDRHIYVKNVDADKRDPQLRDFLDKHGDVTTGLTTKWFKTTEELRNAIQKSIAAWVEERMASTGSSSASILNDSENVPDLPKKLIGRDELLDAIPKALEDGDHVLLQAHGGAGKTALAATITANWLDAHAEKSVIWLRAGTAEADAIFAAIAQPFGQSGDLVKLNTEGKAQAIKGLLRQSGVSLVVLDDVWNGTALGHVRKALPRNMPLLVTSRQRYEIDMLKSIPDLSPEAALDLLGYHDNRTDYSDNENAQALCQTLGNLAFAVEIAGNTLKRTAQTPAELLKQIEDNPHRLEALKTSTDPARATVTALIETSLDTLDDDAKAAFMAFGAFWSPVLTPELLGLYLENEDAESLLIILLENGLATRISTTDKAVNAYRVHDLGYAYARTHATPDDLDRALTACLNLTERHNEPKKEHFAALRPALDQFMGAQVWAFEREKWEEVEKFAHNLYVNSKTLQYLGLFAYANSMYLYAIAASDKRGDMAVKNMHLANQGNILIGLGEYKSAIELFHKFLLVCRQNNAMHGYAKALDSLGNIYRILGDYVQAHEYFEKALKVFDELGHISAIGNCLNNLGLVNTDTGNCEIAKMYFEQSIYISQQEKDLRGEGKRIGNLGIVNLKLNELNEALLNFQKALTIAQQTGEIWDKGNWLGNIGNVFAKYGNYEKAKDYYLRALEIARHNHDIPNMARWMSNLGLVALSASDFETATTNLNQSLAIYQRLGLRSEEATDLKNLGVVCEMRRDYFMAEKYYESALILYEILDKPNSIVETERSIERVKAKLAEADVSRDDNT